MEYPDNTRDGFTCGADLSGQHTAKLDRGLYAKGLWDVFWKNWHAGVKARVTGFGIDPAKEKDKTVIAEAAAKHGSVFYTVKEDGEVEAYKPGMIYPRYEYGVRLGPGPWKITSDEEQKAQADSFVRKDTNPKDAIASTKVPLWLLSPIAKAAWALAQFAGMAKYGAWNWRKSGVRSSVYLSAMERHMDAYKSGEEFDPVDGTHHLGNIMACCAILLDAKAAGKLNDDRPPSVDMRPTYKEVEAQVAVLVAKYSDMKPKHYTIADTEKGK